MFWVKVKRILRAGFVNFFRNGVVSLTSLLVMSATLFIIAFLILSGVFLDATLKEVKDKVDINVYMRIDAKESDILALSSALEKLPEVAKVEYVSKEKALEIFKERHAGNSLILQSLEEVATNPLRAVLNVKAREPSQYETIAKFLENEHALSSNGASVVEKVNYRQNKVVIDRLNKIIESSRQLGIALAVMFVVMTIAVTFNTIRLAIYTSREEITVMRLVGASNNYVRGPFVVEGMIYGLVSALLVMGVLYPLTQWTSYVTKSFFGGIDLYSYYVSNFFELLLILLTAGVFLGSFSSLLAVHRYLKV